jgi:hypothetical protein
MGEHFDRDCARYFFGLVFAVLAIPVFVAWLRLYDDDSYKVERLEQRIEQLEKEKINEREQI